MHLGKANMTIRHRISKTFLVSGASRSTNLSVERRCGGRAAGDMTGGEHIGGVPSGHNIHQCGIFGFYNGLHVRGISYVPSV